MQWWFGSDESVSVQDLRCVGSYSTVDPIAKLLLEDFLGFTRFPNICPIGSQGLAQAMQNRVD